MEYKTEIYFGPANYDFFDNGSVTYNVSADVSDSTGKTIVYIDTVASIFYDTTDRCFVLGVGEDAFPQYTDDFRIFSPDNNEIDGKQLENLMKQLYGASVSDTWLMIRECRRRIANEFYDYEDASIADFKDALLYRLKNDPLSIFEDYQNCVPEILATE